QFAAITRYIWLVKVFRTIATVIALAFAGSNLRGDTWPVVLTGQPAPGIEGARFKSLGHPSVNSSGVIVFNGGIIVGDIQGDGIFQVVAGTLSPVVLEGQS